MIYNILQYFTKINIVSNKNIMISIPWLFCLWITWGISTYNFYSKNWTKHHKLLLFQNLISIYSIGLINTIYYYICRLRKITNYSKLNLFFAILLGNLKISTDFFYFIIFLFEYNDKYFFKLNTNILPFELIYNSFSFAIYFLFDLLYLITLASPYTNDYNIIEQSIFLNKMFFISNAIIYVITMSFVMFQLGIYQLTLFLKDILMSIGFLQILTLLILWISIIFINLLTEKFDKYN